MTSDSASNSSSASCKLSIRLQTQQKSSKRSIRSLRRSRLIPSSNFNSSSTTSCLGEPHLRLVGRGDVVCGSSGLHAQLHSSETTAFSPAWPTTRPSNSVRQPIGSFATWSSISKMSTPYTPPVSTSSSSGKPLRQHFMMCVLADRLDGSADHSRGITSLSSRRSRLFGWSGCC